MFGLVLVLVLSEFVSKISNDPQLDLPQYSTPNPYGYGTPRYGQTQEANPSYNPDLAKYGSFNQFPERYGPPDLRDPRKYSPGVPSGVDQYDKYKSPDQGRFSGQDYGRYGTFQSERFGPGSGPGQEQGPNAYRPENGYGNGQDYQGGYNRDYQGGWGINGPRQPPPGYGYRELLQLLQKMDIEGSKQCSNNVAAQWNFETNVNEFTQIAALEAQQDYTDFQRHVWEKVSKINPEFITDPKIYRQLRLLSVIGPAALPPDQIDRYNRLINDMLSIYNSASVCEFNSPFHCGLRLQPDLSLIMGRSRDWDELAYYWSEWRRLTGSQMRDLYQQLIDLSNKAAKLNNFTDTADYWMFPFESASFKFDIEDVWSEIKPVYELLHAYVRRKLRDFYGPERINPQAPLPAHIMGNMWAQSWSNILDITVPYPGKNFLDVSADMVQQGYTPVEMFHLAEEFFVSLNMTPMPPDFWHSSILEQPPTLAVLCQPSAWDFCNSVDFRIKMCTKVTMKDLVTAHHEMAHIQYFLHYRNLPKVFRDGANPGFHEAVGEAIALSVATPGHLQTLGLVSKSVDDLAHDTNFLYAMALEKLPFLPFALAMDKWRWDIFQGTVSLDDGNCHWWRLREELSGIKPPYLRSESDFDPGSKYHIPANIPYIRYFVGTILQFQIHRALCRAANQFDPNDPDKPLHKCDIYRSKEAGRVLSKLMSAGSSRSWSEILFEATGESRLDGTAVRDYFRPLEEWLRSENLRTQDFVGWIYDGDYCKQSLETANLQVYGGFYNGAPSNKIPSDFFVTLSVIIFVFNYNLL